MHTVVRHRVRYHEADAQGILFNSRYLELADVAMTEYFRSRGFPYLEMVNGGLDPTLGGAQLRFLRPARFEDVLEVRAKCTRVGTASFDLTMAIVLKGETIAEMTLSYVNLDVRTSRSRPLPANLAEMLTADVAAPKDQVRSDRS